ncbi:hypothetical protein ABEB36_001968 [Hypothenemus hampei]|uniref:Uncharacterized protein n=1 Tax=Hypothenemus hampei TaxID=57062 RepID=A0ABD1FGA2_HYPHA
MTNAEWRAENEKWSHEEWGGIVVGGRNPKSNLPGSSSTHPTYQIRSGNKLANWMWKQKGTERWGRVILDHESFQKVTVYKSYSTVAPVVSREI